MTTERIDIQIREDGSRVVVVNINRIGEAAQGSANNGVNFLKKALAGLVTGAVVNKIRELADEFTTIQNRLRLTTTDQANLNAVFRELQDISSRTRSDLTSNVELYSRLSLAAKNLGVSQQEVLQFTESVNKAIKISGASASEASGGLIQLAQGLASGALRGDELNSVMENLPAVADVISKSLGITRGQLRQLGQEGKITGDIVLKAFREARVELDEKFKTTIPTISEGFVLFKNQLLETVGALDSAANGSSLVGEGLVYIINGLKTLTPELVNFVRALNGTLDPADELSNSGKVLATIFTTVYGVLKSIASILTGAVTIAFKSVGKALGADIAALNALLHGQFKQAFSILKEGASDIASSFSDESNKAFGNAIDDMSSMFSKIDNIWNKGSRDIRDKSKDIVGSINTIASEAAKAPIDEKAIERSRREIERFQNQLRSVLNEIAPLEGAELELAKATLVLQRATNANVITVDQQARYLQLLKTHYVDILDPLGKYMRLLDEEASLLGMSAKEREVEAHVLDATQSLLKDGIVLTQKEVAALREKFKAIQDLNTVTKIQDDLLSNSVEARKNFVDQLTAIKNLLENPSSGFTATDASVSQIDILRSLGIDLEATQSAKEAQLAILQDMYSQVESFRQANLISETQAGEALAKIRSQQLELQLSNTVRFFDGLSGLQNFQNEKLFKIGKAAAIAQATVAYYQAIMNAYATQPWYVGLAQGIFATGQLASVLGNLKKAQYKSSGFMSGGYTGSGAVNDVAGVVHGQEYVLNASTTRRIGVPALNNLQRTGALPSAKESRTQLSVEINNYGTDKSFEVQQVSDDRIRIIAKDVARQEVLENSPRVVASEIGNPNSTVSKAMSRNINSQRRR